MDGGLINAMSRTFSYTSFRAHTLTHTRARGGAYDYGNPELCVSRRKLQGVSTGSRKGDTDQTILIGSTCDGGQRILTRSSTSASFLREEEEEDLEMFPGR